MNDTYEEGTVLQTDCGRFRVLRLLGRGGAASTYKVENSSLGAACVLKIMHREVALNQRARDRFLYEARASASIGSHPNLVPVTALGTIVGSAGSEPIPFHVMDWAGAKSVRRVIDDMNAAGVRLSMGHALALGIGVLQGLQRLHQRGVLHRDIKPDNILAQREGDKWVAKIIDLGAAYFVNDAQPQECVLTPKYAAPEQFDPSNKLTEKVDVFATALLVFEMLTGVYPYGNIGNDLRTHTERGTWPAPLLSGYGVFPDELSVLLLDALSSEPERRPDVSVMLEALRSLGNREALREQPVDGPTIPDVLRRNTVEEPLTRAGLSVTRHSAPPDFDHEAEEAGVAQLGAATTQHEGRMPRDEFARTRPMAPSARDAAMTPSGPNALTRTIHPEPTQPRLGTDTVQDEWPWQRVVKPLPVAQPLESGAKPPWMTLRKLQILTVISALCFISALLAVVMLWRAQ